MRRWRNFNDLGQYFTAERMYAVMKRCNALLAELKNGGFDGELAALYAPDGDKPALEAARSRAVHVAEEFIARFGDAPSAALFSGPGRTEIGGNHTDHQHGHVLCGSVDLDTLACAAPNGGNVIRVVSEGYPAVEVDLGDLTPKKGEENTSAALVRGVAAKLTGMGYALSGFDAYAVSNVIAGAGLSSSASYEVLLGNIFNRFFCGGKLDPITIAKVGQYAENAYFGKPCGLMDQMGSSIGGAVFIDFADPANPIVERADYDFGRSGHALCIVDTGSCHADLTDDYADITREMGAVAAHFGKRFLREVLRDIPLSDFRGAIPALRTECGDRAVLRAMHFFNDDRRAAKEYAALKTGDFDRFLELVNDSGLSSELLLQNIWSPGAPKEQAVSLALTIGKELLGGEGAIRVHGGGFAGTVQAFVPNELLDSFKSGMEAVLGEGKCHILRIRAQGGCVVVE